MVVFYGRMKMTNAIKIGALILVLLSAATMANADEPPRRPPNSDALLQNAYRSKDPHVLQFIRDQERRRGPEGLRDPIFRAELKGKLDLLSFGSEELGTEALPPCPTCSRNRAQFNEREVRRLRELLARSEQNQNFNMQPQMNQDQFGLQQQPGFGGNFFNTNGSTQGLASIFAQILGNLMGMGQQTQSYNMFGFSPPNYSNNTQWSLQAPAIAGPAMLSTGQSYGYSQAPAIAGTAWSSNLGYSNIVNRHYSLINNGNYRTNAPAVLPAR